MHRRTMKEEIKPKCSHSKPAEENQAEGTPTQLPAAAGADGAPPVLLALGGCGETLWWTGRWPPGGEGSPGTSLTGKRRVETAT